MTVVVDDFVMLGKTVPEPNSDGRVFVCSAGVSAELRSLIRIYPLARRGAPKRWATCRVPLERNRQDSRLESFKIAGDRTPGAHERINEQFTILDTCRDVDRMALLDPYTVGSIDEANARRRSLAVIHPEGLDFYLEHNPESPDSPQLALFEDASQKASQGHKRFPYNPRLRFKDDCGWHNLSLRDWGCFELMRKHDPSYYLTRMAGALHLDESSSLLVGNQNHRRTSWLVISVLQGIRSAPSLFDAIPSLRPAIPDAVRREVYERDGWACRRCGETEGLTVHHIWPYSRGGTNALDNLQTLCGPCNSSESDRLPEGIR